MKVYIVHGLDLDQSRLEGVYSTHELADQHIREVTEQDEDPFISYYIRDWEVL